MNRPAFAVDVNIPIARRAHGAEPLLIIAAPGEALACDVGSIGPDMVPPIVRDDRRDSFVEAEGPQEATRICSRAVGSYVESLRSGSRCGKPGLMEREHVVKAH